MLYNVISCYATFALASQGMGLEPTSAAWFKSSLKLIAESIFVELAKGLEPPVD